MSSTERYIRMRIAEIRDDLLNLPTTYPDTYGQAFAHWCQRTDPGQEAHLDRQRPPQTREL